MTENKRFKFICDDENCFFKDDDKVIDCLEVVDLLNELHEENQQLFACKEFCNSLKKENEALKSSNMEMEDYLARIEEENEQLKQFNNEAIELILDGIVEMHNGKRDYAETIFNKAIRLLKGDVE